MRRRPPAYALLFLPVLFLAGCPVWGDDDGGGIVDCVGVGCACFDNFDCSTFFCDDGRCARPPLPDAGVDMSVDTGPASCRTNGDCPVGRFCGSDNFCTASSTCDDDEECGEDFICDFRATCVPRVPGACRADGDCDDQRCIEGFCRDDSALCQFAFDCSPGQACIDGGCIDICAGSADVCGSGTECDGAYCRPSVQCQSSSQCGAGEHCVDARCLPDCAGSSSCGNGADYCAEDSFCRPDWNPPPFCSRDSDCTDGSVCRLGACRTPCPNGTDAECRATDPTLSCGAENLCVSSSSPECALSRDCNANQDCVNAECIAAR
ncbi:MAG: hypothetical protein AAF411_24620 [Myxococcota bacterium]